MFWAKMAAVYVLLVMIALLFNYGASRLSNDPSEDEEQG